MMSDDESSAMAKASSAEAVIAELENEIARLRAENDRLRAGRLQAETVNFIRHELFLQWNHAEDAEEEVDAVVADLDRCYPPDEV